MIGICTRMLLVTLFVTLLLADSDAWFFRRRRSNPPPPPTTTPAPLCGGCTGSPSVERACRQTRTVSRPTPVQTCSGWWIWRSCRIVYPSRNYVGERYTCCSGYALANGMCHRANIFKMEASKKKSACLYRCLTAPCQWTGERNWAIDHFCRQHATPDQVPFGCVCCEHYCGSQLTLKRHISKPLHTKVRQLSRMTEEECLIQRGGGDLLLSNFQLMTEEESSLARSKKPKRKTSDRNNKTDTKKRKREEESKENENPEDTTEKAKDKESPQDTEHHPNRNQEIEGNSMSPPNQKKVKTSEDNCPDNTDILLQCIEMADIQIPIKETNKEGEIKRTEIKKNSSRSPFHPIIFSPLKNVKPALKKVWKIQPTPLAIPLTSANPPADLRERRASSIFSSSSSASSSSSTSTSTSSTSSSLSTSSTSSSSTSTVSRKPDEEYVPTPIGKSIHSEICSEKDFVPDYEEDINQSETSSDLITKMVPELSKATQNLSDIVGTVNKISTINDSQNQNQLTSEIIILQKNVEKQITQSNLLTGAVQELVTELRANTKQQKLLTDTLRHLMSENKTNEKFHRPNSEAVNYDKEKRSSKSLLDNICLSPEAPVAKSSTMTTAKPRSSVNIPPPPAPHQHPRYRHHDNNNYEPSRSRYVYKGHYSKLVRASVDRSLNYQRYHKR